MIDFQPFFEAIEKTSLKVHSEALRRRVEARYLNRIHGDHHKWQQALDQLPDITVEKPLVSLAANTVGITGARLDEPTKQQLVDALKGLHPWRKGPFNLHGVFIDTEWRSDWKWQRLERHIQPLAGKYVLDVGCGNGYHCWRMAGAGAKLVIGVDPAQKFLLQFHAVKKYLGDLPVFLLPLMSEELPPNMGAFDTVFSMGVLYHRKSPFSHLEELKAALKPGGELVLETLVVEGDRSCVLVPGDRYGQMRNVWFLPSPTALVHWLQKAGFENVRTVSINTTSTEEQRATEWMSFHSLADFLDSDDPGKTVEGYPAPTRAILIASKPN